MKGRAVLRLWEEREAPPNEKLKLHLLNHTYFLPTLQPSADCTCCRPEPKDLCEVLYTYQSCSQEFSKGGTSMPIPFKGPLAHTSVLNRSSCFCKTGFSIQLQMKGEEERGSTDISCSSSPSPSPGLLASAAGLRSWTASSGIHFTCLLHTPGPSLVGEANLLPCLPIFSAGPLTMRGKGVGQI